MVHAFAGNLLMTTGSYDDATKAFSNANKVSQNAFAIYQRARCYLAIGDIKNAMADLHHASKLYSNCEIGQDIQRDQNYAYIKHSANPIAERDKCCLELILDFLQIISKASTKLKVKESK